MQTDFHYFLGTQPNLEDYCTRDPVTMRYTCSICFRALTRKEKLFNHLETFHFPDSFSYNCTFCTEVFNTRERLSNHRKKHRNPEIL